MSEWKEIVLGEVINTNQSSINRDYPFSDILYLDTGSITRNRISSLQKFSLSEAPSRAKRLVKDLDIIFSSVRPNQLHYGIIRNPAKNLVVSTGFVVISCIKHKIAPYYLYYYLSQSNTTKYLHSIAEGSTSAYPSLKPGDIETFRILLPPLPEQRAIASVLSSLDDKIDLLHRQNHTLEQMAETLFRQWFVEEADEGWKIGTLNDVLTVKGGTTPSTKNPVYWDGDIHWTSPRDITTLNSIYLFDTERKITKAGLKKISSGLLPTGTLLMSSRAPVGVLAFAEVPIAINQGYIAILDEKGFSKEFLFLWLKTNMDYVQSYANGSTFLEISKSAFKSLEIQIPPEELRNEFQEWVTPHFKKIKSNQSQIRTLTALRDTLLPKLMSGEVRVADTPVIALKKTKVARPEFKEAILIAAIVRTLFTPKIGHVSRQWYQKIAYLHKRKLKELKEQQSVFELTTEYSKKAAGPYKKKMRYQGPEGICLKNKYLEAVNNYAFTPSEDIHKIDNYFDKYWNRELFENWTIEKFRFVPVKKLGVYATVDYSLLELKKAGKELSASNVLDNISESKDWKHKKDLPEFSPQNIEQAINDLKNLYTY